MGAVFDNRLGALHRALAAQVGDALLGDDDVDGVLAMVEVRHHGDDGADASALGGRRAREDGDVGAAGKVARTANAVHHLRAADVCRVDITVNVGFDGSVH